MNRACFHDCVFFIAGLSLAALSGTATAEAAIVSTASAAPEAAAAATHALFAARCSAADGGGGRGGGFTPILQRRWIQQGGATVRVDLPQTDARDALVEVTEQGIEVGLEVLRTDTGVRSDSPLGRAATQWAFAPAGRGAVTVLSIKTKGPLQAAGRVELRVFARSDGDRATVATQCAEAMQRWATADADYARARDITLGRAAANAGKAREMFNAAAQGYADALKLLAGPNHALERGEIQLSLAVVAYYDLQDWAHASSWAAAAANSFGSQSPYRRARAQAILAAAWIELATVSKSAAASPGIPRQAKIQFAQARGLLANLARFHTRRRETYDETLQINNIGLAYFYEARFEAAVPYFARARPIFEQIGDTSRAAVALQNMALCSWGLGRLTTAVAEFDDALHRIGPTPYPDLYLLTLNNSGLAHFAAGQLDESLRLQSEALDFATRSQSDRARARSFYGIGITYYAIGDRELAAQFLRSALELCTAQLDARIRVATLRALALIEYERAQHTEAIRHDSEALQLATAPSARARILLRLAQDNRADGNTAAAIRILDTLSQGNARGVDPVVRAMARIQRGGILRAAGSYPGAHTELLQGIRTLKQYDCLAELFDAQTELAHLLSDEGRTADALSTIRQAVSLSRELRVQTANPEYRSSIVQALRPALEFEVELLRAQSEKLIRKGRLQSARRLAVDSLRAVDDFRAMSFEDWRSQHLDRGTDPRLDELVGASATLYRDIAERRFQLATRDDRFGTDDAQARLLREDLAHLRVRLGTINSELAARTTRNPVAARRLEKTQDWFARFRTKPADHAFVEYWLGSGHAYAWVIHQGAVEWVSLTGTHLIVSAAEELHHLLRAPERDSASRIEGCAALYRLVWAPISTYLGAARTVIVIPDGALDYVPFAALRDAASRDSPYLVQKLTLADAPALRLMGDAPRPATFDPGRTTGGRILIVADPVYSADDSRLALLSPASAPTPAAPSTPVQANEPLVTTSIDRVSDRGSLNLTNPGRLASTAREAQQIQALYRSDQVDLLMGPDATRENLLAKDLSGYRFIHIASHGIIDAEIPQLSALLLSKYGRHGALTDPYLRAGDLLTRNFNAQTVVLSACDTALGKEFATEGLVGLRYAALARGAQAVVASLWPVADGISADLMTDMYREVVVSDSDTTGVSARATQIVATALNDAMRHLLARTPGLDPRLWAPFSVYVASD